MSADMKPSARENIRETFGHDGGWGCGGARGLDLRGAIHKGVSAGREEQWSGRTKRFPGSHSWQPHAARCFLRGASQTNLHRIRAIAIRALRMAITNTAFTPATTAPDRGVQFQKDVAKRKDRTRLGRYTQAADIVSPSVRGKTGAPGRVAIMIPPQASRGSFPRRFAPPRKSING